MCMYKVKKCKQCVLLISCKIEISTHRTHNFQVFFNTLHFYNLVALKIAI
jgi:hypothetical protein